MSLFNRFTFSLVAALAFVAPADAAIPRYGVLIGTPTSHFLEPAASQGAWPHYVVNVSTPSGNYRAVINMFSRVDEQVMHREVAMAPFGNYNGIFSKADGRYDLPYSTAAGASSSGALDFLRHPAVLADIRNTPWDGSPPVVGGTTVPVFDSLLTSAKRVYIFGAPYDNSDGSKGIHDVHQNQGNQQSSSFGASNGLWQDGAMIIEYAPSKVWIPRTCGVIPPCWGGYYLSFPNRTLVMTRFRVQEDFTESHGHASTPTTQNFALQSGAANTTKDYGPFYATQFQIDLGTISGNPDVYIQTGATATEASYRARSINAAGKNEFIRDNAGGAWVYVRVKANAAASTWNLSVKYTTTP